MTALDVVELRKTLADPGLCKYPEKNIQALSDEAATREGILAAVARMAKIAEDDQDATFSRPLVTVGSRSETVASATT